MRASSPYSRSHSMLSSGSFSDSCTELSSGSIFGFPTRFANESCVLLNDESTDGLAINQSGPS